MSTTKLFEPKMLCQGVSEMPMLFDRDPDGLRSGLQFRDHDDSADPSCQGGRAAQAQLSAAGAQAPRRHRQLT